MSPTPNAGTRTAGALAALYGVFTLWCLWRFSGAQSPDLMATWLAGYFYGTGALVQVYPSDTTVYTMLPPSDWWPYLQSQGRAHAVFPFVYPPLWAALASWITPYVGIDGFRTGASVVNPVLLAGMVTLACRAAGLRAGALVLGTGLGLVGMLTTLPGAVALEQNQPQILVSFLIVAAIERDRAGAARLAGGALAVAAAIKLYPVLLALLWIAARRWRSATAFAVAGGAMGLASIALAGWPLHQTFLHEVGIIKNTVLVTSFTYGLDPTLAQFFAADRLSFVAGLDNPADAAVLAGWSVLTKGTVWSAASIAGIAGLTSGTALWLSRKPGTPVLIYPAFLTALALLSPLSWGYHYLPALAFAPVLIPAFGARRGGLILLGVLVPVSIGALGPLARVPFGGLFPQLAGTLAMAGLGAALWIAARRDQNMKLHPDNTDKRAH